MAVHRLGAHDYNERGITHVSELAQAKLTESVNNFSSDFIGNVQLHHTHIRRAEWSIACWSHDDGGW